MADNVRLWVDVGGGGGVDGGGGGHMGLSDI